MTVYDMTNYYYVKGGKDGEEPMQIEGEWVEVDSARLQPGTRHMVEYDEHVNAVHWFIKREPLPTKDWTVIQVLWLEGSEQPLILRPSWGWTTLAGYKIDVADVVSYKILAEPKE